MNKKLFFVIITMIIGVLATMMFMFMFLFDFKPMPIMGIVIPIGYIIVISIPIGILFEMIWP